MDRTTATASPPHGSMEAGLKRWLDLIVVTGQILYVPTLTSEVDRAHRCVDDVLAAITDNPPVAMTKLQDDVRELERLKRRVDAARLRLVALAQAGGAHEGNGFTDSGAWLAGTTKGDRRPAAADADLADALGAPEPTRTDDAAGSRPGDDATGDASDGSGRGSEAGAGTGVGGQHPDEDMPSDAGTHPATDGSSSGPTASDGSGTDADCSGRPRLAATADALAEGLISTDHAKVVARAMRDLPEHLTSAQYLECERELLALAVNRSPSRLRAAARRVLERVEPDPEVVDGHEDDVVTDEEERAMESCAFWLKDNQDGTMTGHFTVPWASGMTLKKVLDAMTAPRRQERTPKGAGGSDHSGESGGPPVAGPDHRGGRPHDGDAGVGTQARGTSFGRGGDVDGWHRDGSGRREPQGAGWRATQTDWQHERGLAFADLLTRIPTDHLHNKSAATLLITTRLEDLRSALTRARVATTDITGQVLSSGATRRLACSAGLVPAVLGTGTVPIDLGRQARLFSDAQRLALAARYTECATEGCDRPFAWTEVHHLRPWEAGGRTDMDNAIPLCGRHHHMIDSPRWRHATHHHGDGTAHISFHRRP